MAGVADRTPDLLPVLSRGRHRSPRKGACFMEMASFLAGERWSDHPSCTHRLLAGLARQVNDTLPDSERWRIAPFIPEVIGLVSDDVRVEAVLAARCASTALPVVAAERQNVLAVGLLSAERVLARLDGRTEGSLTARGADALAQVPLAERWARGFGHDAPYSERVFRRQTAPHIVALAVDGLACACVDDPNAALAELLRACIADVAAVVRRVDSPVVSPVRTVVGPEVGSRDVTAATAAR